MKRQFVAQRTQSIIDTFRGLPGEFYMLKGLLCLDMAVEREIRGRGHATSMGQYHEVCEARAELANIYNCIPLAERMDEIAANSHMRTGLVHDLASALRDIVGYRTDLTEAPCHRGLTTAEKCGRCSRQIRAWDLLDAYGRAEDGSH